MMAPGVEMIEDAGIETETAEGTEEIGDRVFPKSYE